MNMCTVFYNETESTVAGLKDSCKHCPLLDT